ncbi:hypothetical protein MUK42_17779 [Musa troglodytarum]|uniref:Uncharacterized protein n=1 Tax=Musa troglodytarum TaxID=320322 RepID=A0A9E7HPA5_9LILI|nr:hypothetical protein MUK42_17779 [Musa troglodytarum]
MLMRRRPPHALSHGRRGMRKVLMVGQWWRGVRHTRHHGLQIEPREDGGGGAVGGFRHEPTASAVTASAAGAAASDAERE